MLLGSFLNFFSRWGNSNLLTSSEDSMMECGGDGEHIINSTEIKPSPVESLDLEEKSVRDLLSRERLPEILQLVAPKNRNVQKIKNLIKEDKQCVKCVDKKGGDTVLHRYCANINEKSDDQKDLLEFFIEIGANINAVNINLESPLHISAKNNKYQTVRYLMLRKADALILDKDHNSCLHLAVQMGCVETVAVLHEFAGKYLDENMKNKHDLTALDMANQIEYNDQKLKMEIICKILQTDPEEYRAKKGYETYLQRAHNDELWRLKPNIVYNTNVRDNAICMVGQFVVNGEEIPAILNEKRIVIPIS